MRRRAPSLHFVGYGGEVDFAPDGKRLVFDRRDEAGDYQLFTIDPDGSNEVCISVPAVVGGPRKERHKGFPAWHRSGAWIVCQVEMEMHNGARSLSEPGRGHQCDVWVCRADGSQWWKLTNYSGVTVSGVLNPRFSPDGTKLLWASKTGGVTVLAPWGVWNLQLADFSTPGGVPTLSNITTLTPGGGHFYESQGFSRDSDKICFTSDAGLANPYGLDVFLYTLADGTLVNLSNSPSEWDEHASYAPHGDWIAWASSRGTSYDANAPDVADLAELQLELVVAKTDGTERRTLTHFNTAGFVEYGGPEHSGATVCSWHPDGSRLAVARLSFGANYDKVSGRKMWIIDLINAYS